MSKDFTLAKYTELLQGLKAGGYRFITFEQYCTDKDTLGEARFVILRHDVDLKAANSLATARIEHALDIQASYYFRVVEQSNQPEVIKDIVALGHEIGYHYEDMALCEGDAEKALRHFEKQLSYFRQYYPVRTLCMHGAPTSRYDGRDLWKYADYHDYGLVGEPYFDVDFSKVFYLTDTGRRWDGFHVSLRDKVPVYQEEWIHRGWVYHRTDDLLKALQDHRLPRQLMVTTHPQRWTDHRGEWCREKIGQSLKNGVKRLLVHRG